MKILNFGFNWYNRKIRFWAHAEFEPREGVLREGGCGRGEQHEREEGGRWIRGTWHVWTRFGDKKLCWNPWLVSMKSITHLWLVSTDFLTDKIFLVLMESINHSHLLIVSWSIKCFLEVQFFSSGLGWFLVWSESDEKWGSWNKVEQKYFAFSS